LDAGATSWLWPNNNEHVEFLAGEIESELAGNVM
jgi:hypothetical protein